MTYSNDVGSSEMHHDDEQQSSSGVTQQQLLRYVVKDAVDREVGLQVAPLRSSIQIFDGQLKQFDKELGTITLGTNELRNIVFGNEALGITGFQRQIRDIGVKIDTLIDQRDAIVNQMKGIKVGLGVIGVLITLTQGATLLDGLATVLRGLVK